MHIVLCTLSLLRNRDPTVPRPTTIDLIYVWRIPSALRRVVCMCSRITWHFPPRIGRYLRHMRKTSMRAHTHESSGESLQLERAIPRSPPGRTSNTLSATHPEPRMSRSDRRHPPTMQHGKCATVAGCPLSGFGWLQLY